MYIPRYPCPDQDREHFLLLCPFPDRYFLSSSPRGNNCSDLYYIDEFCLFLSFIQMESCSAFCFRFWLLWCSTLSLRFTYAVFSSSLIFIMWIFYSFYPFYCWLSTFGLLWIVLLRTFLNLFCWVCIHSLGPSSGSHLGYSLTCFSSAYIGPVFMTIVSLIQTSSTPTQLALNVSCAKGAR